ncbi:unnamed protein product [Symbiodinium sp. KB8]|nr:unnamed protein product [Symbiodinium sp. KB8]
MSQSEGETDVAQAEDADGQEAQEVEADESETEVEEPAEPAGTVAETSAYGGGGYRIIYSCSRASVCCLCQAKSTDPTPLDDPGMDGVIPWAKYRKMQHEGETVRVPEGKIDLICLNVFRATGLNKEHKNYTAYFAWVSKKENQAKHKGFLASRKEWVKQHNENPDKVKLSSKGQVQQAAKLLKERTMGGRLKAPKKQFVTEQGWDPEIHGGPWDPSKVEELEVLGEIQKGIWVSVGKKGVFDYEEYDDRSMKEQRIEHDSDLQAIFGEEALSRKRKASVRAFQAVSAKREASAVQGQALDLASIVQQMKASGSLPSAVEDKAASGSGSESSSTHNSSGQDSSAEDSSEDENVKAQNFFGGSSAAKPKAVAKEVSSSSVTAGPKVKAKAKAKTSASESKSSLGSGPKAKSTSKSAKVAKTTAKSSKAVLSPLGKGGLGLGPGLGNLGRKSASKQSNKDAEQAQPRRSSKKDEDQDSENKQLVTTGPHTEQPREQNMLNLDGRAQRTLSTCRETLQELVKKLEGIDLTDKPPKPDKESRAAHRVQSIAKSKELTALAKTAKDLCKRMEKSPNKDHICAELDQLEKFAEAAASTAKLLTAALPDATDSVALCSAFEANKAAPWLSFRFGLLIM